MSDNGAPESEKKLESDQEEKIDNSNNISINHTNATRVLENAIDVLNLSIGEQLPADWLQTVIDWLDVNPDDGEKMIVIATQLAIKRNQRTWAYVEGILMSWYNQGIVTVADIEKEQQAWKRRKESVASINENEIVDIPTNVDIANTDWSQFK